ncbi:MAG TPA: protein kinase [Candidatus Dormibacteraeota bacterium]|nr:protein kinase [Candidatus Dormibacteraeota bacterium]
MSTTQLGRYPIEAELGRGAMGVVYRSTHPRLEIPVAIKVLSDQYSSDPSFRQRFHREAATVAALNHPGIVRVYDFDEDGPVLFIVMEWVDGRSMRSWLDEYGRFSVDVSIDLIQQLLSAVGVAHDFQVVHRDLKPDNILISNRGKTKILDFGISKLIDDKHRLTATGSMVGTPAYMAPEQVKGEPVDATADIYSLGMILYELLHGEPPFTGQLPAVLHSQVFDRPRASTAIPSPIMDVIWRATAKDPAQRFRSCEEFAGAFHYMPKAAVAHPPVEAISSGEAAVEEEIEEPKPLPTRTDGQKASGVCTYSDCGERRGWACAYQDMTGRKCNSWWCRRHIQFIERTPFCPRHASVIRALAPTANTIFEIKNRPAVDDRALPLAALVAEDVDKDVTELVRRRYQNRKDVTIARDRTVRQTWSGRNDVAWERSWAALKSQGYLIRIAVRVAADEPDIVQLLIGNTVVFKDVPDWITRRREGESPDHADRARFGKKLFAAILEHVDSPRPVPSATPATSSRQIEPPPPPEINRTLIEGMVLRIAASATKVTGYEFAEALALPFAAIEPILKSLTGANFLDALGLAQEQGPWLGRPLPERMSYSITKQGRTRSDQIADASTRYMGPAPVSMQEYKAVLAEAAKPGTLDLVKVSLALSGIELAPGVMEAVRAAVNSRSSIFIYGAPGNGKTTLARRIPSLLGGPIILPVALDVGGGEVMEIFDGAIHRLEPNQPADKRWRRVARPLVQVGGEFQLEMFDSTWEEGSRVYGAPLQVKANGGVLLIDDLGRQRVSPKQILDRLLVPLEQDTDFLNLTSSGRKVEIPFQAQLALSTNLKPGELLDEAYLRRLAYKVLMPDPTWEMWCRIFERERARLTIPAAPQALEMIQTMYGGRPLRGNHPRDLLERLVDVSSARGVRPQLTPELIEAAWNTLFVAS